MRSDWSQRLGDKLETCSTQHHKWSCENVMRRGLELADGKTVGIVPQLSLQMLGSGL